MGATKGGKNMKLRQRLGTPHGVSAIKAFVTGPVPDRDVSATIAEGSIAHHGGELTAQDIVRSISLARVGFIAGNHF